MALTSIVAPNALVDRGNTEIAEFVAKLDLSLGDIPLQVDLQGAVCSDLSEVVAPVVVVSPKPPPEADVINSPSFLR